MFLVDLLRPNVFVELGTQWGDSYCAFCQSVQELNLGTRCYAIDTWEGDAHTGFYGSEVLADLRLHHDPLYGSFSTLIKSTFDDALKHFLDASVDLLHIDGYHTYEVVRHDFESWLPKMSSHGVVLFHDVNVREDDFGVWRLWDELKEEYPHFEFVHGHGLGVLAVGGEQPANFRTLLEASFEDVVKIRNCFFNLGSRFTLKAVQQAHGEKEHHLAQLMAERDRLVTEVVQLQATVQIQQQTLTQNEKEICSLKESIRQTEDRLGQEAAQFQATVQIQQQTLTQNEKEICSLKESIRQTEDRLGQEAAQFQATTQAQQRVLMQKEEEVSILKLERRTLTEDLADKDLILNRIFDSHGWQALLVYYKLREILFPEGTRRRNFAKQVFHVILTGKKGLSKQADLISTASSTHSQKLPSQDASWAVSNFEPTGLLSGETKNQDYAILSQRISELRRSKIESLYVKPPTLISIRQTDLVANAKSLIFPAEDKVEVSIIIPVFNNLKFTLECLTSLMKYSSGVSYEVIVVDDGSSDQTPEVLSRVPNITNIRNETNLGFVHTCNRGAEKAKGKYVLFLNNDAQVTENWLRPLVETFNEHENVGAVGPKILFPDGRLQEAGALVNRDCTSRLIGLSDDPDLPKYNYVREVMYCSGACLLVEANKFKELGGFDVTLAPAYCEDWDLAFRLREQGLRVMYNPKSVVIHHLSVTSNSVEDDFKMRCVIRNQQKLSQKWQCAIDDLNKIKLIALYLPQFHPIPENDRWWGKGFTEWTNVAKARPNYIGHYQPHLPADLGFYDLRVEEVMEQQAELAKRYGIYGFCYFYYWFAGKRLLDLPLERMLRTHKPNIPFCLCWANENWTRRWDGLDHEVLIAQEHSDEDDSGVIFNLIRYMQHQNYIRINGKPLLIVYHAKHFPDIKRTTQIWRDLCRKEGVGEIYLAMAESFEHSKVFEHPSKYGFDASMEYPPHGMHAPINSPGKILNPDYAGMIHDYREVILKGLKMEIPAWVRFRTVMPSWDNTPRRQNGSVMFENTNPETYQALLEAILDQTHEQNFGDERILFINAWNEWGEGNHLEPDMRHGHGYLEATRNALDSWLLNRKKWPG
jgi:GT2 family glycosyltransferase